MARARALKLVVLATLAFAAVPMSPAAAHDPEFYYHRTVPAAGQNYVHWYTVSTPQTWTPALELAAHAWNSLPANLDLLYIGPAAVNYNPRGTCAYDVTDLWDRGRTNGIHHIDDSAEFPGQPGYNGAVIVCDATGGTDASLGETIVTHQMLFDVRRTERRASDCVPMTMTITRCAPESTAGPSGGARSNITTPRRS